MAKNTEAAEAATEATEATETKTGAHAIVVKVPATPTHPYTAESFEAALKGDTKEQKRAEFIREYAETGNYSRSTLTQLARLAQGLKADDKSLKYQIIFQATKTVAKSVWPQKVEEAPAPAAAEA